MSTTSIGECDSEPGALRRPGPQNDVRVMHLGLDIVITDAPPARLPGETRTSPRGSAPDAGPRHRLIARESGEYLFVGVGGGRDAASVPEPAEVRLGPGDICFYDARHPPTLDFPERFRMKVYLVPRELLGLQEPEVQQIVTAPVRRSSRLGTLLSPFLSDLARTAALSQPPVGELLARNAGNLLATLAAELLRERVSSSPDASSPLLRKIMEYIERNLADAKLSPEAIAQAHHISVRYLHKLFHAEGTTVGRWIQHRRLEECRRDLMLPAHGNQTIAAVAGRWGFVSATHFSRVFRSAYGMSPRQWRESVGSSEWAVGV
ncbi:helix-turn-helix domain-containing protein [Streptomyces sp. NPDC002519]